MLGLLFISGCFFALGFYLLLVHLMKLPTYKTTRAMRTYIRGSKCKKRSLDSMVDQMAMEVSGRIKLGDYDRRKWQTILKSAEIPLSPETYVARAYVKAFLVLGLIIPALLIFPLAFVAILFLAIGIFFKERNRAYEMVEAKREIIEGELPRFVATLTQELKAGRNVLAMLEAYKKGAGIGLKSELEITTADMRSGSYESALTRLEARISSPKLSDVVRGLMGVLRGDDGVVYFQMLSHDLKILELQALKTKAMKQPGRIRKYSFAMLGCFLLMYMTVIFMQIIHAFGQLF